MLAILKFLSRDQSAATAVEYGVLIALVALAAFFAVSRLGTHLNVLYDRAGDVLEH